MNDINIEEMKESVFCYEFYHQYRRIMEKSTLYDGLVLNAEITKHLDCTLFDIFTGKLDGRIKYPDFILHKGQNDVNRENQLLAIEVKTSQCIKSNQKDCNVIEDINKLMTLTDNSLLEFDLGVFISVNMDVRELKDILKNRIKEINSLRHPEKIICIGTSYNKEKKNVIDYFSIIDLMKDNKEYEKLFMEREYKIEDDLPLMESINHFAQIADNRDGIYKFIEILRQIEMNDIVYLQDLIFIEKEFNCPIRDQLVKGSGYYLGYEITKKTELNRFLGVYRRGGVSKLSFNKLRNAINAIW